MELLKRNEFGLVRDKRAENIANDIENVFNDLCDKYDDVPPIEIESVIHTVIGYYASRRTSKLKTTTKGGN